MHSAYGSTGTTYLSEHLGEIKRIQCRILDFKRMSTFCGTPRNLECCFFRRSHQQQQTPLASIRTLSGLRIGKPRISRAGTCQSLPGKVVMRTNLLEPIS